MAKNSEQTILLEEQAVEQTEEQTMIPDTTSATLDMWLERGGKLAPIIGGLIGIAYLSGYMIVNFYLNALGVRPPNLITSRYLATGILYLVTIALPISAVSLGWRAFRERLAPSATRRDHVVRWLGAVIAVGLVGLSLYALPTLTGPSLSSENSGVDGRVFLIFAYILNSVLWGITVYWIWPITQAGNLTYASATRRRVLWIQISGIIVMIPVVFLTTAAIFAGLVYRNTNPAYGGGAPTQVQLILSPDNSLRDVLPMSGQSETTDMIDLIDQNDDGYIVSLSGGKQVVVVPRDAVRGVIVKPYAVLPP